MNKKLKKTISWNITATLLSTVIFYIATGSVTIIPFAFVANLVVFPICYYVHETIWENGVRKNNAVSGKDKVEFLLKVKEAVYKNKK